MKTWSPRTISRIGVMVFWTPFLAFLMFWLVVLVPMFYAGHLYDQIRIGMSQEKVRGILWLSVEERVDYADTLWFRLLDEEPRGDYFIYWVLNDSPIEIHVDDTGRVDGVLPSYE